MARLLSHYRVKKSVGKILVFGRLIFGNWVLPGEGRGAQNSKPYIVPIQQSTNVNAVSEGGA
jgi:hypothetical protein